MQRMVTGLVIIVAICAASGPAAASSSPVSAAAGGHGEQATYTTTQVSRLPVAQEQEGFGHGDVLFARDAAALAWRPLLSWLHDRE